MTEDIAPKLIEEITATFRKLYQDSGTVADLLDRVQAGTATYAEAQAYSVEVSRLIGRAWAEHISSAVLPDGRMYYNISSRLLPSVLDENHVLVANYTVRVQQALNARAGLGLQAQAPAESASRVDGLVEMAANAEQYDEIAGTLETAMETFSQSVVDDTLRANVEFQGGAGLRPKIIRRAESGACKWCRALAGVYTYPDVPRDVYRRHGNCRCVVEYDPGSGRRQDVHTKQWTASEEHAKIETRKAVGKTAQRSFQSEALLQHHYEKHVGEFGEISIPEYLRRANAFAEQEVSKDVVSLLRSDGSISKYCFSTNEFIVINSDGTIRTYFKPEQKEAYWQIELDRNN